MPRPELLIIVVLAAVFAGAAAAVTESFQPLPMFVGVIAVGAYRSWRLARQKQPR